MEASHWTDLINYMDKLYVTKMINVFVSLIFGPTEILTDTVTNDPEPSHQVSAPRSSASGREQCAESRRDALELKSMETNG